MRRSRGRPSSAARPRPSRPRCGWPRPPARPATTFSAACAASRSRRAWWAVSSVSMRRRTCCASCCACEMIASASACTSLRRFSISSRAASSSRSPWSLALRIRRLAWSSATRRISSNLGRLGAPSGASTSSSLSPRSRCSASVAFACAAASSASSRCDGLAALVLRVGDLGLHPRLGLAPLHAGAVFAVGQLRDLQRLRAHARGEAGDRGVDLVLVVAAECRGERDIGRRVTGGGDQLVERGRVIGLVVAVRGVVLRHRGSRFGCAGAGA